MQWINQKLRKYDIDFLPPPKKKCHKNSSKLLLCSRVSKSLLVHVLLPYLRLKVERLYEKWIISKTTLV